MRFSPQRLRDVREARGLSQEEVARRIGKSYNTVRRYENGLITPTVHALADLAGCYGCSVDDLYDPGDPDDAVTAFAAEIKAITDKFPPLSAEQKRELRALLRGVA